MTDVFTPAERSRIMSSIKGKDTKPELIVRRMLHGAGYRFRVHVENLPGRPDLYFSARAKAVFVNGCFWHGHEKCRRAELPKSNRKFWEEKIRKNVLRDERTRKELAARKIESLVVWECELADVERVARELKEFLGEPRSG